MKVQIREIDDGGRWGELLLHSINPTLFHDWKWLKIIEKHTGARLHPMVASSGENDVGIMPLFMRKTKGLNLAFSPPPKTGLLYMGPLLVQQNQDMKRQTREKTILACFDAFEEHIQKSLKPNYIRLATPPGYDDARPFTWNGYDVSPEFTYYVDLSKGEDAVFENYSKQLRVDLKKTEKEGVTVKQGGKKELDIIHKNLQERFIQQGVRSNLTREYLHDLYDAFHPQNLTVFAAEYQGEQVSGFISINHQDRASYWAGGGKTAIKGIYPNDLLQWEAMKWAIQQGYKRYEIVDAGDQRLRHFKSKFNPDLKQWFQAEKYNPKTLKHIEKPARTIFQKLKLGGLT